MITLAVSSYSLLQWRRQHNKSLLQTCRWLAEQGVAAIEFSGIDEDRPTHRIKRAGQLKKTCDQLGLVICGYCVPAELLVAPKVQRKTVETLKQHVDVAAALGVASMRHDVTCGDFDAIPRYRGPRTFNAALKIVTPVIQQVADYAQTQGVKTSLENHGFYCQAPDRVEKIIKTVAHENFGLTLDMGNFLCVDADPVAAVKQLLPYAFHVHVKDFHIKPKKLIPPSGWFATPTLIALRGAIVGHGQIDIPAQLKLLKQAKYAGYLSLEFEGMEDSQVGVVEGLKYLQRELDKLKMG